MVHTIFPTVSLAKANKYLGLAESFWSAAYNGHVLLFPGWQTDEV